MGQSGSFQMMYGWQLDEEQSEQYEQCEGPIRDLVEQGKLDDDVGGNLAYDGAEWVVGKKIGPWMMNLGVLEVDDDYGEVDKSVYDELQPYVKYFGREPRKYLVMSYG